MEPVTRFAKDEYISFDEPSHTYTDPEGNQYSSVSKILGNIEKPFDRETISRNMARAVSKDEGIALEVAQRRILAEWDKKRDSSLDRGNWIHNELEKYHTYGDFDERLGTVVDQLREIYKSYHMVFPEVLVYDKENHVAGQTDLVVQRTRGKASLYDFYDYKTNESNGILFDSVNRKKDEWKHYNKYFLAPMDHLEDCNYNRYSLQLSMYALMASKNYGIKVGKLGILFITKELNIVMYPVPYMRFEAEMLLSLKKKNLPVIDKEPDGWDQSSQESNNGDDW